MKQKTFQILLFTLLNLSFCLNLKAQKLNIKNYSADDGMGQSEIMDIIQDHNDVIWMATNVGGVSSFDGIKFTNITSKQGLSNNHANVVFEDENQVVWIGTAKGLNKYENKTIVKITDTIISQLSIFSIHKHSNGELWFGTNKGIVIYNGKTFSRFALNDALGNFQVWCIKQDKNGNTWIATMLNGVFYFDGKKMMQFGIKEGLNDLKNRDLLINGNKIWVATYHGINVLDISKPLIGGQRFDSLKLNGKPYLETTYRIYKDNEGIIWVGNKNGVMKIENNRTKLITKNNGLCNLFINAITEDKEGNMWFGSAGGGLSRYKNNLFISINEQQGLANNNVMAFLKDKNNNMWIATWGGGVSRIDYKAFKEKDTIVFQKFDKQKGGFPANCVSNICEDRNGNIWFATSTSGVIKYDGKNFTSYDVKNGLDGVHIQSLLADKQGSVWIGNENGVNRFDGKKFKFYSTKHGFSAEGVSAIYEDDLGFIWFGSTDRIVKYNGKEFTKILRSEGFPHIKNIIKDKLGYMWFSTDAGACMYNGKVFRTITENDGLVSNAVDFIRSDEDGNLWIGTNKGIDKLDLDLYINQKTVVIKHYGKEEGFTGGECNQNAFYLATDGKMWFGTVGGVMIYDPKLEGRKNKKAPQVQLTGIRLFLEPVDLTKYSDSVINGIPVNFALPYNKNHVTFDFIGISHTDPDKVKYKYKLEGADNDWLPEGKEMYATYSNLPIGRYTFMLKAANADNVWNSQPLTFSFEIISPIWKRPWFYLILILIGISLIYFFIKIRERRLRFSKRLLERQVNIRTQELFEEKEKLQIAYSEIDEKNKAITDSIHYAKRIQNALLPTDTVMKQLFPDSFVLFKPKDIVSGDFYWMEQWGHQTLIAVADCTGHGVPGAFMSIVGHNILTQAVNVLGLSKPALILNETNKQLSRKLNQNTSEATVRDGMDIAMVAINYAKSTMEFAGANNPVWIIRNGEVIEIKGNKFPIGVFIGEDLQKFTNHEWELQKGDYIYIFSDGFADQFGGEKGKKFKFKQLQHLLLDNHKKPLVEQRNILEKAFESWQGRLEQVDDVLIIGIRV